LATGIKALNISFSEQQELIWSLCAEYDVCGQSRHSQVHGELGHAVEIEVSFPCYMSMAGHYVYF
jgi:hypothetical protein